VKKGDLNLTMAVLIIGLVIMGIFLYVFGSKIIGYFLSQDYTEAACEMASKKSGDLTFKSPIVAVTTAVATAVGGVAGCAIGAAAGILGGPLAPATMGTGCVYTGGAFAAVGASAGYILGSAVRDVNVFIDSGIVTKCGIVLPPINGTKDDLALRIANASLWGCEFSKLTDKSRATLVRSVRVNVTSGGNIGYNDVKIEMDAIYDSYGVPAEKRCAILWRINGTPIDCGQFRLQAGAPTDAEIDAMAAGVIKEGEPVYIRMTYCNDRFLRTDKSFISIIGNATK